MLILQEKRMANTRLNMNSLFIAKNVYKTLINSFLDIKEKNPGIDIRLPPYIEIDGTKFTFKDCLNFCSEEFV